MIGIYADRPLGVIKNYLGYLDTSKTAFELTVYDNLKKLTHDQIGSAVGTYNVSWDNSNVTLGGVFVSAGGNASVPNIEGVANSQIDNDAIEFTIEGTDFSGNHFQRTWKFPYIIVNDGADGLMASIVWKGEANYAPANPEEGWLYRDLTNKGMYLFANGVWNLVVLDGVTYDQPVAGSYRGQTSALVDISDPILGDTARLITGEGSANLVYVYTDIGWEVLVSDGDSGIGGLPGVDGMTLFITYSTNAVNDPPATPTGSGVDSEWGYTSGLNTNWMSQKVAVDVNSGTWSNPILVAGLDGENAVAIDGQRGPGWYSGPSSVNIGELPEEDQDAEWDYQASFVYDNLGKEPVDGDVLTLSYFNTLGETVWSEAKVYQEDSLNWSAAAMYVDGTLLVEGSIWTNGNIRSGNFEWSDTNDVSGFMLSGQGYPSPYVGDTNTYNIIGGGIYGSILKLGDPVNSSGIYWNGSSLDISGNVTIGNPADVRNDLNVDDGATRNVNTGEWQPSTPYIVGDIVTYDGSSYSAVTAHTSGSSFDSSKWLLFVLKGTDGIPGTDGADGVTYYTWVKYADTPTSGMSDFPSNKEYLGIAYNKTTSVESENYSDYTWSLIKGDQGIPGAPGADGQTTYTWIKYGTSSTGANLSDSPVGKTYIGVAVNKTTASESNTASDYTWSLIQGPQGIAGADGADGTDGTDGKNTSANWLNPKFTMFSQGLPAGLTAPVRGTVSVDTSVQYLGQPTLKLSATGNDAYVFLSDYAPLSNTQLAPRTKWLASFYVRSSVAGKRAQFYMRSSAGAYKAVSPTLPAANTWYRYSGVLDYSADDSSEFVARLDNDGGAGCNMWYTGLMLEPYADTTTAGPYAPPLAAKVGDALSNDLVIKSGGIRMASGGSVKSDNYSIGSKTGVFMGYEGGQYQLLAGNGSNYVHWNGAALNISGNITGSNITGSTLQTSNTGKRILLSAAADALYTYNADNVPVVRLGVEAATVEGLSYTSNVIVSDPTADIGILVDAHKIGQTIDMIDDSTLPAGAMQYGLRIIGRNSTDLAQRGIYCALTRESNNSSSVYAGSFIADGYSGLDQARVGVYGYAGATSAGTAYGLLGISVSGSGVYGSGSVYDFYANGVNNASNFGPFTGGHDCVVSDYMRYSIGDIAVDYALVHASDISNTIFKTRLSVRSKEPAVGVFTTLKRLDRIPSALQYTNKLLSDEEAITVFNALGEGQINVCGEGGDLRNGDLIVTSSIPGKGMRQNKEDGTPDDVVRNITVAKVRGDWEFASSDEIRMVPCIYLCG